MSSAADQRGPWTGSLHNPSGEDTKERERSSDERKRRGSSERGQPMSRAAAEMACYMGTSPLDKPWLGKSFRGHYSRLGNGGQAKICGKSKIVPQQSSFPGGEP